jgi:cytochrome c-type biogenesis protein CcmE
MVLQGSFKREPGTLNSSFVVTDNVHSVNVKYNRILPDLFREGAGAVVVGRLGEDGEFVAEDVLAKHDENYMPPEVAEALEKAREAQGR